MSERVIGYSAELGKLLARALAARPHTMSLVIRVADWGPSVTYEWSSTGVQYGRNVNVLGPKDQPELAALQEAIAGAVR